MRRNRWTLVKQVVVGVALCALLGLGVALFLGVPVSISQTSKASPPASPPPATGLRVALAPGMADTLSVPAGVREALGIRKNGKDRYTTARLPQGTQPLPLSGSTAFDPAHLNRVRARFAPAEVVEIGKVTEDNANRPRTVVRELRPGDTVVQGQVLGVFYSVDVGSKKNDLIDALVQLKLDEEIFDRAEKANGVVPEVFILNARRNVESDRNAVNRAVKTLETWNVPPEDIEAVRQEAGEIIRAKGKRDPHKEKAWGRVELRSPVDGVIVERNVSEREMVVDNTVALFQIAQADRLLVVANASEDDVPLLNTLPTLQRRWLVRTAGVQSAKGAPGTFNEIGMLVDPNQHSVPVKGYIDNRDHLLRAGQYVTATVELPPPPGVVEVDTDAIADDGRQCLVFVAFDPGWGFGAMAGGVTRPLVREDPAKPYYTLRRVNVTHRFDRTAYVSSVLAPEERQLSEGDREQGLLPKEPLAVGERLIVSGILELKKELDDRQSDSQK